VGWGKNHKTLNWGEGPSWTIRQPNVDVGFKTIFWGNIKLNKRDFVPTEKESRERDVLKLTGEGGELGSGGSGASEEQFKRGRKKRGGLSKQNQQERYNHWKSAQLWGSWVEKKGFTSGNIRESDYRLP